MSDSSSFFFFFLLWRPLETEVIDMTDIGNGNKDTNFHEKAGFSCFSAK